MEWYHLIDHIWLPISLPQWLSLSGAVPRYWWKIANFTCS